MIDLRLFAVHSCSQNSPVWHPHPLGFLSISSLLLCVAVCAPRGRSRAVSGGCSSLKRKLRARSHWPTGCGQETVVDSKPRGFQTQLPKAFVKWPGFRDDPGLGPTPGMWPRWLRMGKGQDRLCLAALPGVCSPEPDSSTQRHLMEEVCAQRFVNHSLLLPAKPSAHPGQHLELQDPSGAPGVELGTPRVS